MAATMDVYFDFGGTDATPGTNQDTDALGLPNIRFKTADDATIDTANPIPVPAAGTNYSYWKQIYLYCAAPDGNSIDNVKFYSDGTISFGTGVTLMVLDATPVKNSGSDAGYLVATGTPGTTGTLMTGASTDAASLTSGAALTVSISEAGAVINLAGETSNYVTLQVNVITTAAAGLTASETLTFQYDETP